MSQMIFWPKRMREALLAEEPGSHWRDILSLPDPKKRQEAWDWLFREVERETFHGNAVATATYMELAPLVAEQEAISKAVEKMPELRAVAPEILTPMEALEAAKQMYPTLTPSDASSLYLRLTSGPENRPLGDDISGWKRRPVK